MTTPERRTVSQDRIFGEPAHRVVTVREDQQQRAGAVPGSSWTATCTASRSAVEPLASMFLNADRICMRSVVIGTASTIWCEKVTSAARSCGPQRAGERVTGLDELRQALAVQAAADVEDERDVERQPIDEHAFDLLRDAVVGQCEVGRGETLYRLVAAHDRDVDLDDLDAAWKICGGCTASATNHTASANLIGPSTASRSHCSASRSNSPR